MAVAYNPPGVNVEELFSPTVTPLLAASAQVCVAGLAQGYQTATVQVTFAPGGDPEIITAPAGSIFQKVDTNQSFEIVRDVLSPTAGEGGTGEYVEATDFAAVLNVAKDQFTITPTADTDLDTIGATASITYRYVPEKYYTATRLDSLSAVQARYGQAFDATGVVTPLSAAASLAFENGAPSVVIQPLFKIINTDERAQPTPVEAEGIGPWQSTFIGLRDIEDVNVIVPAFDGSDLDHAAQLALLQTAQDHVRYMQLQGQYLVVVCGEEGVAATDLQATATNLRTRGDVAAEQTVVVSPSRYGRSLPTGTTVIVGGQLVAAGVAGMIAARPVSTPLTRKAVSGFVSIEDSRDKAAKDADAAVGLMVIETKGANLQVRHGLTVDNTSTARRELSVVRAKHRMIESIRDTVDTQIVGTVPADGSAPFVVKNAIIGVLELLRQRRELVDYTGVESRVLTNDPTTVEVRFNYLPAFPLNYVNVIFSLDLSTGSTATTIGE